MHDPSAICMTMIPLFFLIPVHNREETCEFPGWLLSEHHQFQNLNQTKTFHFNQLGTSLTITEEEEDGEGKGASEEPRRLKCNSVEEEDEKAGYLRLIMQVNFEW